MSIIVATVAALARAAMVARTTTTTPHHRTANETASASTTRTRMRTERPIHKLAILARIRQTRTRISRTPKRVESAHRGVLRLVQSTGVGRMSIREGMGAMELGAGGVLVKTRGCIRMRERRVVNCCNKPMIR